MSYQNLKYTHPYLAEQSFLVFISPCLTSFYVPKKEHKYPLYKYFIFSFSTHFQITMKINRWTILHFWLYLPWTINQNQKIYNLLNIHFGKQTVVWIIQKSEFIKIIHNCLCNALHVFGRSDCYVC